MSAVRRGFLFIVPVATAAVVVRHPADPTTAADLGDRLSLYIGIHVVLLMLLPLLGLVLWTLLRDIESTPATVSRVLTLPAVAFYAAFDALVGIAAGVLAREALVIAQSMAQVRRCWRRGGWRSRGRCGCSAAGAAVLDRCRGRGCGGAPPRRIASARSRWSGAGDTVAVHPRATAWWR